MDSSSRPSEGPVHGVRDLPNPEIACVRQGTPRHDGSGAFKVRIVDRVDAGDRAQVRRGPGRRRLLLAHLVSPSYDCVVCVAQHANGGVVGAGGAIAALVARRDTAGRPIPKRIPLRDRVPLSTGVPRQCRIWVDGEPSRQAQLGPTGDRAKEPLLWPDPSRNWRKLAEIASLRPGLHHREIPGNKRNSGLASAWIAPRRSPVRVRLAPLGESLQWPGFSRFGWRCVRWPAPTRWPSLWPSRRPEAALRFAVNPVLMRFRVAHATQSRGRNGTFLVSARFEPLLIREHREARRRIEGHGFRDDRRRPGQPRNRRRWPRRRRADSWNGPQGSRGTGSRRWEGRSKSSPVGRGTRLAAEIPIGGEAV